MLGHLTPGEAFNSVYLAVERYIGMGLCWKCAIIMAADNTGVHRDRVEDVWIRKQADGIQPS